MSSLTCARCLTPIVPGELVEIISAVDITQQRIVDSDEALFVHAGECPIKPDDRRVDTGA